MLSRIDIAVRQLLLEAGFFLVLTVAMLIGADLNAQTPINQDAFGFFTNSSSHLVGWWSLDESGQTNFLDRAPNHLTGSLNPFSSTVVSVPGLFSNALSFAGNSSVNLGNNAALNLPQGFTISAWVQGGSATEKTTLTRWDGINGNGWEMGIGSNGVAQLQFWASGSTTQTVAGVRDALSVRDERWHHVAGVYDPAPSQATIYVDGWPEASGVISNWSSLAVQSFVFGNLTTGSPNPAFLLDEVQLYGVPFSHSSIDPSRPSIDQLLNTYSSLASKGLLGNQPLTMVTTNWVFASSGAVKASSLMAINQAALSVPVYRGIPQNIDSSAITTNIIDETEHTYNSPRPFGSFADCQITRTFGAPITQIKLTIESGEADDIGYVGTALVTDIKPSCTAIGRVMAPMDVTSQVLTNGNVATFLLRAKENCCCSTGWGEETAPGRLNAKFHWEVTLGAPSVELEEVSFGGAEKQAVKDIKDKFAKENGADIQSPEWKQGTNAKPICYIKGSSPKLTAKLKVIPDLGSSTFSAKLRAEAIQEGTTGTMLFEKDVILTGNEVSIDLTTADKLASKIDNTNLSITWKASTDGGATFTTIATTSNQLLAVWDTPAVVPTYIRLNYWCSHAAAQTTTDGIASIVGLDAVSNNRFSGDNSIFGNGAIPSAWTVMDGIKADCGTLSTLMKLSLEELGVNGAAVKFVYAVHNNWSHLMSDTPATSQMEQRVAADPNTILGFRSGGQTVEAGWNIYEGCCLYNGKLWMGGSGDFKATPFEVLKRWTSPNTDGARQFQHYFDISRKAVSYPGGSPPPFP